MSYDMDIVGLREQIKGRFASLLRVYASNSLNEITANATIAFPQAVLDYVNFPKGAQLSQTETDAFEICLRAVDGDGWHQAVLIRKSDNQAVAAGDTVHCGADPVEIVGTLKGLLSVLIENAATNLDLTGGVDAITTVKDQGVSFRLKLK